MGEEEVTRRVADDIGIDPCQVQQNLDSNTFTVLVHEKWVWHIRKTRSIPLSSDSSIPKLSNTSRSTIFATAVRPWRKISVSRIAKPPDGSFKIPEIKKDRGVSAESSFMEFMGTLAKQVYQAEWEEVYQKSSSTLNRYHHSLSSQVDSVSVIDLIRYLYGCPIIFVNGEVSSDSLKTPGKPSNVNQCGGTDHSNIVSTICGIVTIDCIYLLQPHQEYKVQDATMFSPASLSGSYGKVLFVIFQMLHAVNHCHQRGVSCGNVSLSDFSIDERLWVQFTGPKWNDVLSFSRSDQRTQKTLVETQSSAIIQRKDVQNDRLDNLVDQQPCAIGDGSCKDSTMEALPDIMQKWAMGQLSNFDYLMILNRLANRQMGNPNHHPIMPWVMDFTQPDGGYRDFSKSKYRLNKGDNQLDFTYESALQMQAINEEQGSKLAGQVPHHISDVLSEITYYIYKARRTPKSLLQTHVRSVWVPNEYPASMQRLQAWTPDECIPEFFSDATIFRSVHDDLPDLEVPTWCEGPEDFIKKHRAVLESIHVSERLHRWIDLTFGCKLSGSAAVKAKNVVLCVVDQHTIPANNGVVQLFNVPHPKRFSPSPYMSLDAPDIERTQIDAGASITITTQEEAVSKSDDVSVGMEATESGKVVGYEQESVDGAASPRNKDNLMISGDSEKNGDLLDPEASSIRNRSQSFNTESQAVVGSYSNTDDSQLSKNPIRKLPFFRPKSDAPIDSRLVRPELATIVLPEEYDPLSALNQLESLYSFTSRSSYDLPANHQVEEAQVQWQQLVARDVVALGCCIAELCLAPKLRFRQIGSELESRWRHLQRVVGAEYQELPRPVREIVLTLLKMEKASEKELHRPWELSSYFCSSQNGFQPLCPGLLLQPNSVLVPFPRYFHSLHRFLSELHLLRFQVYEEEPHRLDLTDHQAMNMVHLARQWLSRFTQGFTEEGRDILLPYIRSLFEESSTAVYAALSLFNKYAAHLGPKMATKELLAPLSQLFDSDFTSPDYLLLFQHSFLSQVIMSLGLKPFLNTLVSYIAEATNGLKQCPIFLQGASEQAGGIAIIASGESSGIEEAETFLVETEGISVDEELFGSEDGDDVQDEEERTLEQGGSDKSEIRFESTDQLVDTDDNDVSGCKGDDGSSTNGQISPLDSEGSETISLDKEPDTASISSGNLPSLSEEPTEGSLTNERIPSKDSSLSRESTSSPSPSTHSQTKEQDLLFSSQTKTSDQYRRTYKKQLSSKLYQVSTLVGKSLSDVASESIMWLSHRIGPTLTVRFITPKLLDALSGCYMMPEQLIYCYLNDEVDAGEMDTSSVCIGKKSVAGDINAKPVLKCLTDIAVLYGDQFIFQQYLPFIKETVRRVQRKISAKLEGRLICSVVLLRHILPYLTDSSLMQKLQYLFGKFLHPLLDLMSCTSISFPSGSKARAVICFKLVDILNAIALRIGREMTRDHMTDVLKRFFLCFKLGATTLQSLDHSRQNSLALSTDSEDKYLVIEVDDETNQLIYGSPIGLHARLQSADSSSDLSTTPHSTGSLPRPSSLGGPSEESASLEDMRGILHEVFTPELAHAAYIPLCRLTGSIHMERILDNHEQIWALSSKHEKAMSTQLSPTIQSPFSDDGSTVSSPVSYTRDDKSWSASLSSDHISSGMSVGGRNGFGGNMTVVGNRIEPAFGDDEPRPTVSSINHGEGRSGSHQDQDQLQDPQMSPRTEMNKSKRTLKGTWLSYWEQYLTREDHDNSIHFCQIKLQTFTGHTSGVKALCMMPNENTFLSASKDKTVKIWALRNSGDGSSKSSCQLTYSHHRKTVFDVRLLESQRLVASCDSNVHVWDPINGAAVRGYDLSRNAPSCMEVMPAPSPCLVVSSGDSSIRFIDTRHGGVQQEIRVASGPLGLIRCMAVSQNGYTIGVGFSSGVLSMVDLRTGLLMGGWRAHEGEILQIKPYSNHTFLTSSVDHSMTLWREDSSKVCQFRGATEPVHCVCLSDDQVISATFGNRIGVHTSVNAQANYSSSKLRSDSFKGAIGALSVLPLNKLLLVASDNGSIFLLA